MYFINILAFVYLFQQRALVFRWKGIFGCELQRLKKDVGCTSLPCLHEISRTSWRRPQLADLS